MMVSKPQIQQNHLPWADKQGPSSPLDLLKWQLTQVVVTKVKTPIILWISRTLVAR